MNLAAAVDRRLCRILTLTLVNSQISIHFKRHCQCFDPLEFAALPAHREMHILGALSSMQTNPRIPDLFPTAAAPVYLERGITGVDRRRCGQRRLRGMRGGLATAEFGVR
jgi:hypothetical protein